jgi:hypothetical protein
LKHAEALSRFETGGRKLTDFIDDTEARAIVTDDYQGFEDGWELMKHRAKWHSPVEGLAAVRQLLEALDKDATVPGIPASDIAGLRRELARCVATLEKIQLANGRFNFTVVM